MTLLELLRISESNSNHQRGQQLGTQGSRGNESSSSRIFHITGRRNTSLRKTLHDFSRRENTPLNGNATRPPVMNARDGMLDEGLVLDLSPTSVRYPHYVEGHPCAFLNRDIFSLSPFLYQSSIFFAV